MRDAAGFRATVMDVREERRGRWQVLLDRTDFRVGEHGWLEAVARSGVRLRVAVWRVSVDDAGAVWHVVEKPLAVGTQVEAVIGRELHADV